MSSRAPVYLDFAATTPVRAEVRAAMEPYLSEVFGNPSSVHAWGRAAAAALDDARAKAAAALGARASEIYFVRGGTESDNLAILGACRAWRAEGLEPTVVVSAIEHRAVLDASAAATARGLGRRVLLAVGPDGVLDTAPLDDILGAGSGEGPLLASVMWVNNETGTVLPVPALAERFRKAREAGARVLIHTDAVQAVGKVPVRVDQVPVDLLSVTGHKIYGPKGTGLLFVRAGVSLHPLVHGGGQEGGLRAGTQDVAGAVGLAEALHLAVAEQEREAQRLAALRHRLEGRLMADIEALRIHGESGPRAPHIANVGVPDVDGAQLLMALDLEGVAASGGSACGSGTVKGSHVLEAMYPDRGRYAAVRFSLGRSTTEEAVDRAAGVTARVLARLRGEGGPGR